MAKADRIVAAIIADLTDRRGLSQQWDEIDEATQGEIAAVWRGIVEAEIGDG